MRFLFPVLLLFLFSCEDDAVIQAEVRGEKDAQDTLVSLNKDAMRLEQRDILNYIRRRELETIETGTGVHLRLIEDYPGPNIKPGQEVLIEYRISLLNGKECYANEPGLPESFVVEHDHVESGLHQAIQYLSPGDSALVIIPSGLAHGLVGDLDKIPMRSTIVYDLRLLDVRLFL